MNRWVIGIAVFVLLFGASASTANAAISSWEKGVNILPHTTTDFGSDSMKRTLDKAKAAGINYVNLNIPYYQSSTTATTLSRGGNTPTDAALATAVDYAHSIGLKVSFKIDAEVSDGQWRANINPSDRTAWFTNYGNILNYYGTFGNAHTVEQMVIGTELIKMSSERENPTNTQNWKNMIADLRTVYSGKLTYGANWGDNNDFAEELNQIKFWDKLDYIGVSAYYWLAPQTAGVASVEDLKASWDSWNTRKLKPMSDQWGKPIIFTEVGYRSYVGAHNQPWSWWDNGTYSDQEQSNDYTALFSYWNEKSYMNGVLLWAWEVNPNAGGNGDTGYTPQNKLAEQTIQEWFTNPPSENPVNPSFTVTGGTFNGTADQSLTVTITVANDTTQAVDALVDVEIFNSSYQKIHQKFFDSQHFNAGETKTYHVPWTPTTNGTYPIMVGIFKNDWSQNYKWEDTAGTITVGTTSGGGSTGGTGGGDTTPPPSTTTIDVWWPSDGSTVSGTQPFKALAKDWDVASYTMTWSSDMNESGEMPTNTTDWPHKETQVDVWKWSKGSHTVTFTAKDTSGNTIATNNVTITVQ